jgi:23S rRNA G2445 N2-methylase RlmL
LFVVPAAPYCHWRTIREVASSGQSEYDVDLPSRQYGLKHVSSLWFVARLNLILSGHSSATIYNSDCLNDPPEASNKYDVIVGNPPWGLRLESRSAALVEGGEIQFDANPKAFLDYAFVLEMVRRMKPLTGRVAVLVSNGMLTRPGAEAIGGSERVAACSLELDNDSSTGNRRLSCPNLVRNFVVSKVHAQFSYEETGCESSHADE